MAEGTTNSGSFVQKPFHQENGWSKLEPNPFSPHLNVITAKVQCFPEHEAEAAERQRKMNTQIKAVTATELLLVDVCMWEEGNGV